MKMSDHDNAAPKAHSLEAFVFGVKMITGETNPDYFMEAGHDIVWIVGDKVEMDSKQGDYLEELGFHWEDDGWAWYV
jgi:hypothetical protein